MQGDALRSDDAGALGEPVPGWVGGPGRWSATTPLNCETPCSVGFLGDTSSRVRATIRVMQSTAYFDAVRARPDRAVIRDEWIERVVTRPARELRQPDGRIRRWGQIPEMDGRWLRVILLADGETVHNAFFDRRFQT